jgi:hypothetical protein
MLPPSYSRIYAMAIRSGTLIDRLVVWYQRSDGTIYSSGAGGSGGVYHLHLFASDEYIYYISGRSGLAVTRLSVYTNKKSFTYGGTRGNPFYAQVPSGYQHLGFWGRSSTRVDQIGFYVYKR